jgi:DNA modification methylase
VEPISDSGTTALAAKRLGRRFVGAEIQPKDQTE